MEYLKFRHRKEFRLQDTYKGFMCVCGGWVPVDVYQLGGSVGKWTWKELQKGLGTSNVD